LSFQGITQSLFCHKGCFTSLSCLLFWSRAFVTVGSFVLCSSFILYAPLLPVSLVNVTLHSFQPLHSPPPPHFSARLLVVQAAGCHSFCSPQFAFLPTTVAKANTHAQNKNSASPCVCNIGRIRTHSHSRSHAPTFTPLAAGKHAHRIAIHFIHCNLIPPQPQALLQITHMK
jgi:hypothetical protein